MQLRPWDTGFLAPALALLESAADYRALSWPAWRLALTVRGDHCVTTPSRAAERKFVSRLMACSAPNANFEVSKECAAANTTPQRSNLSSAALKPGCSATVAVTTDCVAFAAERQIVPGWDEHSYRGNARVRPNAVTTANYSV